MESLQQIALLNRKSKLFNFPFSVELVLGRLQMLPVKKKKKNPVAGLIKCKHSALALATMHKNIAVYNSSTGQHYLSECFPGYGQASRRISYLQCARIWFVRTDSFCDRNRRLRKGNKMDFGSTSLEKNKEEML